LFRSYFVRFCASVVVAVVDWARPGRAKAISAAMAVIRLVVGKQWQRCVFMVKEAGVAGLKNRNQRMHFRCGE
jgi:hypothetical protein